MCELSEWKVSGHHLRGGLNDPFPAASRSHHLSLAYW